MWHVTRPTSALEVIGSQAKIFLSAPHVEKIFWSLPYISRIESEHVTCPSRKDSHYNQQMHNICCNNCHHHAAMALEESGRPQWGCGGLLSVWLYCCLHGRCTWWHCLYPRSLSTGGPRLGRMPHPWRRRRCTVPMNRPWEQCSRVPIRVTLAALNATNSWQVQGSFLYVWILCWPNASPLASMELRQETKGS